VGGLFGGGSQIGKADLYTTTVAEVSNSTAQKPTKLNASENITVQATGFTGGHTNTEGGAGGLIGAGGAEDYFYIHTPLVRASIGDNGGVTATKDVSVLASDTIKSDAPFNGPMASAHQSAAGGVAIVEVVSQARVYGGTPYICPCEPEPIQGEVLIAEVGQNATIKGKTFQAKAWQQDVSVKSSAEAYAVGAGASAKANSTADAYTGSIVRIRKGAKITTTGKLDLTATGPNNIFTTSSATAHADGFPGAFAGATAASDKHSHDCVIAELGASLTAGQFTHHAGASPAINNNYGYNKITDAVIDLIIDGFESTPGTQTNDACEDIKATVKIV
jgi:hypothetical protein